MEPITAGLLLGGSLLSGGMGMMASNSANRTNQNIAIANMMQQQRQQMLDRWDRQEQQRLSKLPYRDERGNTWIFNETTGWKMIPTEITQQLMGASDREELARLTGDAQRARYESEQGTGRRLKEGQVADDLLSQFKAVPEQSRDALIQLLMQQASTDIGRSFDRSENTLATQALRSGDSGARAFAELARSRGETTKDAMLQARLQGMQFNPQLQQQEQLANMYNMFAGRAGQAPQQPFMPTQAGRSMNIDNARQMSIASQQPMQGQAAMLNYQAQPNFGMSQGINQAMMNWLAYKNLQDAQSYRQIGNQQPMTMGGGLG